jgi:hypothetical protein
MLKYEQITVDNLAKVNIILRILTEMSPSKEFGINPGDFTQAMKAVGKM